MENVIKLREAEAEDCDDFLRWRNHPEIRRYFFHSAELDYDEHKEWFVERLQGNDTKIYAAIQLGKKIGVIRFEPADKKIVHVNVNLNPEYLQRKYDKIAFLNGIEWFIEKLKDHNKKIIAALQPGKQIGMLRFETSAKGSINVSVNLNPEYLQRKLGKIVIRKGTERFVLDSGSRCRIVARIKKDNIRSIKAFEGAGYNFKMRTEGVVEYEFRK